MKQKRRRRSTAAQRERKRPHVETPQEIERQEAPLAAIEDDDSGDVPAPEPRVSSRPPRRAAAAAASPFLRASGILLLAVLALSPVVMVMEGPVVRGILTLAASVSILLLGLGLTPGGAVEYAKAVRRAVVVVMIPVVWCILQIIPVPSLAHPIWVSTGQALGSSVLGTMGTISVDPGATLVALVNYLTLLGIGLATTGIALRAMSARWVLVAILAAATASALLLLVERTGVLSGMGALASGDWRGAAMLAATVGQIAALAVIARMSARGTRQADSPEPFSVAAVALPAVVLFVCTASLFAAGASYALAVSGFGVGLFAAIWMIRWFAHRWWGYALVGALAALTLLATTPDVGTMPPALAFAQTSPEETQTTQRMIADASLLGSGAGTFPAVEALYRDAQKATAGETAPTTAASLFVEFGPYGPLLLLVGGVVAGLLLAGRSLSAGRRWYFPAFAGSCTVVAALSTFVGDALLNMGAAVLVAGAVGLGLGGGRSRSSR